MTKVNFTACFDAKFEYDADKTLLFTGNKFNTLDENGENIPIIDSNGQPKLDEQDNPVYLTHKKGAKEILDDKIKSNDILKKTGFFESKTDSESGTVFEYEANLFDFTVDYETVETAAEALISQLYTEYSNIRAYTVGPYTAGNSFGIKIVIVIF